MNDIEIPVFTYYAAFAVADVILTETAKKIIRKKTVWAFLPVLFGIALGAVCALIQGGDCGFAAGMFKASFCIAGGAIGSYDIIVKKLKDWKAKTEDNGNADEGGKV